MRTLVNNNGGGLGGFVFLLPVLAGLRKLGNRVDIGDLRYGPIAVMGGLAETFVAAGTAGYEQSFTPDMMMPDTAAEQCGLTLTQQDIPKLSIPPRNPGNRLAIIPGGHWGSWPLRSWYGVRDALVGPGKRFEDALIITEHACSYGTAQWKWTESKDKPLPELLPNLAGCKAFIGGEGGLCHLSAALGLPGVILKRRAFAPRWTARQPWVRTALSEGNDYQSVSVEDVIGLLP